MTRPDDLAFDHWLGQMAITMRVEPPPPSVAEIQAAVAGRETRRRDRRAWAYRYLVAK